MSQSANTQFLIVTLLKEDISIPFEDPSELLITKPAQSRTISEAPMIRPAAGHLVPSVLFFRFSVRVTSEVIVSLQLTGLGSYALALCPPKSKSNCAYPGIFTFVMN